MIHKYLLSVVGLAVLTGSVYLGRASFITVHPRAVTVRSPMGLSTQAVTQVTTFKGLDGHIYFGRGLFVDVVSAKDNSHPRKITSTGRSLYGIADNYPSVSPDGKWVAYANNAFAGGIYIIPTSGGRPHLACRPAYPETISWSPDSKSLVFSFLSGVISSSGSKDLPHMDVTSMIGTCQADGSDAEKWDGDHASKTYRVFAFKTAQPQAHPVWSMDGKRIIENYRPSIKGSASFWDLISINALPSRGSNLIEKRDIVIFPRDSSYQDVFVTFAHYRRLSAFLRVKPGQAHGSLVAKDGQRMHVVVKDMPVVPFTFSPDDRYIAFSQANALYVVATAGGTPRLLLNDAHAPSWGP